MRKGGGFGPPEDKEEIICYKKIREIVTSSLAYVQAKVAVSLLHLYIPGQGTGKRNKWFSIKPLASRMLFPIGQELAKGWDLISHLRSIIKQCEERLSKISVNDVQITMDEDDEGVDDEQITEIHQISEAGERELEQFRLHCLQQIFDKFNLLQSMMVASNSMPTKEEVRQYAQIGNHISASCWLFSTRPKSKNMHGSREQENLNVDIPNFQLLDSGRIAAAGSTTEDKPIDVQTREGCLREILSLLFPLKCASFGVVPTLKEYAYYSNIMPHRLFIPICKAFSGSLDLEFNDVNERDKINLPEISDRSITRLGTELLSLNKKKLQFIHEIKQKIRDMVDIVWPQGSKKYKEDDNESQEEKEEDYHKRLSQLCCFLKGSSLGRQERLDQVTVIFEEANTIVFDVFELLWSANSIVTSLMCSRHHKDYQILAEEMNRAYHVIAFSEGQSSV